MKAGARHWIRRGIILVLLVTAGISIGVVIQSTLLERQSQEQLKQLQQIYQGSGSSTAPSSEGAPQQPYANPQFAELLAINPDLVGWLEFGELSAPVVQTDDNDYYLKHDFYRRPDPHGAVYADARNRLDGSDDNTILYGHNYSNSKQIFYEVERYKEADYARQHPIVTFTTLYEKRSYVVLAAFVSNTDPKLGEVFDYHNQLFFSTDKEMNSFLEQLRARSLYSTNLAVDSHDRLITMSTCGYEFAGERIVLVARELRKNETSQLLAQVTYDRNPAPVMPEIWETLYGKK
ncbi:MAG: class B sortase [Angelakisella sp.]